MRGSKKGTPKPGLKGNKNASKGSGRKLPKKLTAAQQNRVNQAGARVAMEGAMAVPAFL